MITMATSAGRAELGVDLKANTNSALFVGLNEKEKARHEICGFKFKLLEKLTEIPIRVDPTHHSDADLC